ncbi:MAG: starch-binding protein, partial [Bacteroidales bacterium]|nr:starch-binding protein [Bacteroidales bacterium]
MTSYFIKFMLLLMVTLSISQANATVVYYKNTNWQTPKAYMWNGGEATSWPGKLMTNLGGGWYSIDAGSNKNIVFNNGSDNEKTGDLEIPQNVSATAYIDGKWETVTYKLNHPWENVGEWYFKSLTDDRDGFYSLTGKWGDNGCDYECYVKGNTVETQYIKKENIILENNPQKGDECTFTFNPADKSLTVTKGKPLPYKAVYIFGGVNVNEWDNTEKYVKMECNEGVYTYNFTYDGKNALWAFRALRRNGTWTYLVQDAEVTPTTPQIFEEMDNRNGKVFRYSGLRAGRNYTIKLNCNNKEVSIVKNVTSIESEIPVYPNGVSTESELKAYNFDANPVYYLVAQVLNNDRPTPEWQMEKGADGKYHINGFAMRNTNCIGYDNTYVDGVAVRQYTSANSYIDLDEQTLNDLPKNPLSEGRLFNATFDPETGKLTFEEDPSANQKMPFISLVGYMMQQDAEYTTPRGVEGTPAGVTTAKGWQEAWLQYDAEGNLLKDRKGNVMYSTMWPPKNPVYFTANAGGERHYSSDQMTFSPVKAAGKYVAKTGKEWEAELKASDNANADAYKGLDLVDNATYYRYVVDDIWYVGAGKIWTGWAGQTVKRDGREIAQWSNHRNWGYGNKKATDTDGTSINPETTYGVSTAEGSNGNFLFEQPTFFKTIEFFYDNNDPEKASKIYTTLAYGSASIAAKSNKEDGAYKKGSYQPSVSVPDGVTVTGYTIYRYDATTNQLAPIGDDGGKVAEGTTDPNSTEFTFDKDGLADGRYYYVLKVDFSNGRSSKVRSNPFIIYYPGEYTLDANGYQLVKLDNAVNGYEYVTYNSKENGEMYLVNIANDAVTAYEVLPSDKRDEVKALLSSNEGIKWTDKVFVYAPVPSSFKIDAEKNTTINLEDITGYTLGTTTVAPFNAKELVKLDNTGNFAQRTYKAVMNYKETDPNTQAKTDKSTLGKENITMMQMPNVKAKGSVVNVNKIPNSEVLDIKDGEATKQKACNYYEVTLALNFDDPNVITAKAPRFKIGNKVYEGVNAGTRSIKIACVNPLDFANAADITVDAVYYDGTSYTLPATIGEAAVLKADDAKFQVLAHPQITSVHAITSKMLGKNVVAVIGMSTTMKGDADKIGETALVDEYYNVEFAIDDHTIPDFSQILTKDDINFTGV